MHRTVELTMVALAVAGLAGCAATHGNLANSAERLERSAYALQEDTDDDGGSAYRRDAKEFAEEARSFRRTLDDRDADRDDVEDAFGGLSRRYHALRDEVERESDKDVDRRFQPVTEAYLDIEREMRKDGDRDRDRYARD